MITSVAIPSGPNTFPYLRPPGTASCSPIFQHSECFARMLQFSRNLYVACCSVEGYDAGCQGPVALWEVNHFGIEVTDNITWRGWEPGCEVTKTIVLKNVCVKTKKLKFRSVPQSNDFHFSVLFWLFSTQNTEIHFAQGGIYDFYV